MNISEGKTKYYIHRLCLGFDIYMSNGSNTRTENTEGIYAFLNCRTSARNVVNLWRGNLLMLFNRGLVSLISTFLLVFMIHMKSLNAKPDISIFISGYICD